MIGGGEQGAISAMRFFPMLRPDRRLVLFDPVRGRFSSKMLVRHLFSFRRRADLAAAHIFGKGRHIFRDPLVHGTVAPSATNVIPSLGLTSAIDGFAHPALQVQD
jgi:hypothetical protein